LLISDIGFTFLKVYLFSNYLVELQKDEKIDIFNMCTLKHKRIINWYYPGWLHEFQISYLYIYFNFDTYNKKIVIKIIRFQISSNQQKQFLYLILFTRAGEIWIFHNQRNWFSPREKWNASINLMVLLHHCFT